MLKGCSHCGGRHQRGQVCPKKPATTKKITYIDKFRRGRQWRHKSIEIRERDKYLCQVCLREKYNTRLKYNFKGIEVHHIISIKDDWRRRLDNNNLISLCRYHHEMAEKGDIPQVELFEMNPPHLAGENF